jgi:hypothetical protein
VQLILALSAGEDGLKVAASNKASSLMRARSATSGCAEGSATQAKLQGVTQLLQAVKAAA